VPACCSRTFFDYSLDEIAGLVDSTVGGVKAALKRGRLKLAALDEKPKAEGVANPELSKLLHLYVERFNLRDWDGVRELISADARLRVANCFAGRMADSPYLVEYERGAFTWKMAVGQVDGETVLLVLHAGAAGWAPHWAVRLDYTGDRIVRIRDYLDCPWSLEVADSVTFESH
jgi:RNA polymerase sigma-70 factor (ECF subfamily)